MSKIALITGITGQDGSYLAEFLLSKGYTIHGIIRRSSSIINTKRLDKIYQDKHLSDSKLHLHYGDMTDSSSLSNLINSILPDEIYNLAAMSHVKVSFEIPEYSEDANGLGITRILEICKSIKKPIKIYQASTSELYGGVYNEPQNENTPFHPRSPYAISKMYAFWMVKLYRESYNMFAVNGILFNHSSPRRGETFVEQKIVKTAVDIHRHKKDCLYLGNLYSKRDIGHAKDYVKAMWLMLQQDKADDFVISTGVNVYIKDIVNRVFNKLNMPLVWSGEGENEIGVYNGRTLVRIDPSYYRPSEVENLLGDSSKAKRVLNWEPEHTLDDLLNEMIQQSIDDTN